MLATSFDQPNRFGPSRSAVMSRNGMASTSQPLASLAGVDVLRRGGNAVDAAIAAAAMLNVVEPMSTGIGGDAFAIIYEAQTKQVLGLNASGCSPRAATLGEYQNRLASQASGEIPINSPLTWTVPGTVDGWSAALARCGRMSLKDVLEPAIRTAEEGFAIAPQTSLYWREGAAYLSRQMDSARTWLLPEGNAPLPGGVFKNPRLARTLRMIAEGGTEVFYRGALADEIVKFSEANGGLFTHLDLAEHKSIWVEPISISYRGCEILELPPNTQGIATLEALQILASDDMAELGHSTVESIHLQIEAMKLALHDARRYVTDPQLSDVPVSLLCSKEYARSQRARISAKRAIQEPERHGPRGGDTVYICVADNEGNVVSFINSIFVPWGSGWTVGDTGVLLQNRGYSFSLNPADANVIAPGKRTRHTIIPAMLMHDAKPLITFGCVGGDMQPQGHVQFLSNVLDFGMNIQDAIDAPRWRYEGVGAKIALERAIAPEVWSELSALGHELTGSAGFFGGAQAILIDHEKGSFQGGSDSRRDGCAIGY